jgi:tetrahydromethanopterin S-methyltransferase subunit A
MLMSPQPKKPDSLYPWGGDFTTGSYQNHVALALLNIDYTPSRDIAIYGRIKTENIGIEKIVANVISNPNIRFLLVIGEDIRGHRSGQSLVCLHQYGIDENHRIKNAPGAIPYIENINQEAIHRFQQQITIINLINIFDPAIIDKELEKVLNTQTSCFGEPFIAIQMVKKHKVFTSDKRALHSKISIQYLGKIQKRM